MAGKTVEDAHVFLTLDAVQHHAHQAQEQLLGELKATHFPTFWSRLSAIQEQIECQQDTCSTQQQEEQSAYQQQQQQPVHVLCTKLRDALQELWSVVHAHQQQLSVSYVGLIQGSLQGQHTAQQAQQGQAGTGAPRSTGSIQEHLSFGALLQQQSQCQGTGMQHMTGGTANIGSVAASCHAPLAGQQNAQDDGSKPNGSFSFPSLQPAPGQGTGSLAAKTPQSAASFIPLFTPLQLPQLQQHATPPSNPMSFIPIHTPISAAGLSTLPALTSATVHKSEHVFGYGAAPHDWQGQQVPVQGRVGETAAPAALMLCGALERFASSCTASLMDSATCSLTGLLCCLFSAYLQAMTQQQQPSSREGSAASSMMNDQALSSTTPGTASTHSSMRTSRCLHDSIGSSGMMDVTMMDVAQGSGAQQKGHDQQASRPQAACAQLPEGHPALQLHQLLRRQLVEQVSTPACVTPGVDASGLQEVTEVCSMSSPTASASPRHVTTALGQDSVLPQVAGLLYRLGLWPAVQEAAACSVAAAVHQHCTHAAMGLNVAALPPAWAFMEQVPLQFLATLLQHTQPNTHQAGAHLLDRHSLQAWRQRLVYLVYESVCDVRLDQVWDMLVDYPDSTPAVEDLAACLAHTNTQQRFIHCVRSAVSRRLLHPGASAQDVVHTYMTLIRVLQTLDPAGGLLHAVADPVRMYLRSRPDTVRCVVERVTGAYAKPGSAAAADMDNGDDDDTQQQSLLEELQQQEQSGGAARLSNGGKLTWAVAGMMQHPVAWQEDDVLALLDQQQRQHASNGQQLQARDEQQSCKARQPLTPAPYLTATTRRWTAEAAPQRKQAHAHTAQRAVHADGKLLGEVPGSALFGPSTPPRSKSGLQRSCHTSTSVANIVQLLVSVFPSKEHFIMEYRALLARGLLRSLDCDTTAALRTNELLKLRLGEARLHAVEVMLKDVADSKRVAAACHNHQHMAARMHDSAAVNTISSPPAWLSALITSHLFWPPMGGWGDGDSKGDAGGAASRLCCSIGVEPAAAALKLPAKVQQGLEAFAASFHALKAPRKLHWRPHVGAVELQVSVGGVCVEFHVSPVLASLLMAFEAHEQLSVEQIADMVALPVLLVRRRLLFWVEHGILTEAAVQPATDTADAAVCANTQQLHVLRYQRATWLDPSHHGSCVTDEDALDEALLSVGGLAAADKTILQEMGPYEPYVMGVLLSTGGLPLERLHAMLKRFVVSPKYDKSVDQLAAFLGVLVSAGKVVVQGGVYKRKPDAPKPSENA